jgi:DNA topoisomerase VI subunit A
MEFMSESWNTLPELLNLMLRYYLDDKNQAERQAIAHQGNEFVKQNYTFDRMVKNLIGIYEQN